MTEGHDEDMDEAPGYDWVDDENLDLAETTRRFEALERAPIIVASAVEACRSLGLTAEQIALMSFVPTGDDEQDQASFTLVVEHAQRILDGEVDVPDGPPAYDLSRPARLIYDPTSGLSR